MRCSICSVPDSNAVLHTPKFWDDAWGKAEQTESWITLVLSPETDPGDLICATCYQPYRERREELMLFLSKTHKLRRN